MPAQQSRRGGRVWFSLLLIARIHTQRFRLASWQAILILQPASGLQFLGHWPLRLAHILHWTLFCAGAFLRRILPRQNCQLCQAGSKNKACMAKFMGNNNKKYWHDDPYAWR